MDDLLMLTPNFGICSPKRIFQKGFLKPVSLGVFSEQGRFEQENEIKEILDSNIEILDTIKLPNHFSRDEIIAFIEKMIRYDIKDNIIHKQAMDLTKYAQDFHKYFQKYYSKIFAFHKRQNEEIHNFVFKASNIYLKSDFPPSFVRTFSFSLLTDIRFNNVFDAMIHHEKLSLMNNFNNRKKFDRICDAHNNWVKPLADIVEQNSKRRIGLLWHIEFNHSKELKEVFQPKEFKIKSVDQDYFFGTIVELQKKNDILRRMLVKLNKKAFGIAQERDQFTTDMFSNVISILTS